MQYETIILELLSRIQKLEDEMALLKQEQDKKSVSSNDEISYEKEISYKKMTNEMLEICYQYGKKMHNGENANTLASNIAKKNANESQFLYYISICSERNAGWNDL